ncbi:MAG: ParB/RepB/Spo0J family partition protein [Clostridiales bacterium]|jgi:hypothetical protein|nr:ParB/RepB/Spo0J family partition protein [Clostridiales bacterium]
MDIIRAALEDIDVFSKEQLRCGACCFYDKDKSARYFFKIQGREAVLHNDNPAHINKVIEEFLFYSGFVTTIREPGGAVLFEREAAELTPIKITEIQPSQFYINERKLEDCKRWINSPADIMIPVTVIDGKTVSLDGHTRMRAAIDLGYEYVYIYADDSGDSIGGFVCEAVRRGIHSVSQMEIVSDAEYRVKWDKFCDDYFKAYL